MDPKRMLEKVEHDLSHFMISEMCKNKPELRGKPEMYKYKGLSVKADPDSKAKEKTIAVRIGALEAEFKIENGEKNSGALAPYEEHLVSIWITQGDNSYNLKGLFTKQVEDETILIVPFDLEEYFEKKNEENIQSTI